MKNRRFWTADGRYHGETSYEAAIGGNSNVQGKYYFYVQETAEYGGNTFPKGSWGYGTKQSGSDNEQYISYYKLPAAIQRNANKDGTVKVGGTPAGQPSSATPTPGGGMNPGNPQPLDNNANYHRVLSLKTPYNMRGSDVLWVQRTLNLVGNFNSLYDNATKSAVKNFQTRSGLVADGVYGNKTACKMGHPGAPNCGGRAPAPAKPATGGGGTSAGSTAKPAGTPTATKPIVKKEPPYKLPKYVPPSSIVTDETISLSDLYWAQWGVFNAYELALISHNQYFETVQPHYNVIPNITSVLTNTDESQFLIDSTKLTDFATPDSLEDSAVLGFGTAQPTTTANTAIIYSATRNDYDETIKRARLLGVKFLRSTSSVSIDDLGPYLVSYIKRRLTDTSGMFADIDIKLTATATQTNIKLSWSASGTVAGFELYRTFKNGAPITPELVASFPNTTSTWTSPTLAAGTKQSFIVKSFVNTTDINNPTQKVYTGTSNEASATTPSVGPSAVAPLKKVRAINGKLIVQFAVPSPSTNFSYVKFTYKEGAAPTSLTDGTVAGPFDSTSANTDISLINIGTGNRPKDRTFYVACWSFNSANQQTSTSSNGLTLFLRNPVVIDHTDVDSWRAAENASCTTTNWEPGYARMRVSNYGSSAMACGTYTMKYTGLWFYGTKLKTAMGGRKVTSTKIIVLRKDGGSGGAVHTYIGSHTYQTHPTTNTEPVITSPAASTETVARNTQATIDISRFNTQVSNGSISGFGMYRHVAGNVINDTEMWLGQSDANGNAYAQDGRLTITHTDFAS